MFKNILIMSCLIFLLNGCFGEKKEEKWTAFIYPKKEDTKNKIKSPITFTSLEECKKVSILEIKNQNLENIASFNCGLNCIYHDGMKLDICEKMSNE
ncbi:MAG: hypothetical protein AB7S49_12615 [Arcobacter sp.]|jgi:hypothetical protein|uniref:Uncharacterized protein n=1 Tax=Arcobacter defluvii TaxID=873191 RepID=A0AAE7E7U5_9BACT|nr:MULTISPECIES: hypothetical protein [Arcobacter]MDY3200836.1 hypothetical protein [Arcobacter sp.]QKF77813.1 hypothetical protein ADFLV_1796 [Arcobacter defluvii]RXI34218.1 hypothetical protein CP964_02375 [Arcobacter defluvii]BAK73621.1 hypothetical protein ABLL_1746 [Arcobacter sp. L]